LALLAIAGVFMAAAATTWNGFYELVSAMIQGVLHSLTGLAERHTGLPDFYIKYRKNSNRTK
jgi:hypothetical protein